MLGWHYFLLRQGLRSHAQSFAASSSVTGLGGSIAKGSGVDSGFRHGLSSQHSPFFALRLWSQGI